ncbi:hypothetical protein ACXIZN_41605 [Amycolatopsis sp. TRM77291]
MRSDRIVQVRLLNKTVAVDDVNGRAETLTHPGVALLHHHGDRLVSEVWLPVGEAPSYADDEALIAALRAAWSWSRKAA